MNERQDESLGIDVRTADFDPGREIEQLHRDHPECGAVASFIGLVRAHNQDGSVSRLFLQHYPGMTENAIREICEQAMARWPLLGLRVIHRVGELAVGERIVLVAVAGAHRGETFAACEMVMDFLKTRAPFWKCETTDQGRRWVEARDSDERAADRW